MINETGAILLFQRVADVFVQIIHSQIEHADLMCFEHTVIPLQHQTQFKLHYYCPFNEKIKVYRLF